MRALLVLLALALGCQVGRNVAFVAQPTAESTRMVELSVTVFLPDDGPVTLEASGTAWVSGPRQLVTAGHVCPVEVEGFPIVQSTYTLVAQDGTTTPARVVKRSDEPDLCLLETDVDIGPALELSSVPVAWGDPISYIGAPLGAFGDGLAPFFTGHYVGSDMITLPTAGGASGSAVMGPRGVVGVLVAVDRRFHHLAYIVPLDELREFLR